MDLRIEIIKAVQAQNNNIMDRDMCEKARNLIIENRAKHGIKWTTENIKDTVTKLYAEKGCKA